jgi:hypothetical protein
MKARFCGHEGRFFGKTRRFDSPSLSPRPFHIPSPPLPHIPSSTRHTPTHPTTPHLRHLLHSSPRRNYYPSRSLCVSQRPLVCRRLLSSTESPSFDPSEALHALTQSRLLVLHRPSPVTPDGPRTETKGTGSGCIGSTWAGQGMSLVSHVTPTRVPSRPGKKLTPLPRLWT